MNCRGPLLTLLAGLHLACSGSGADFTNRPLTVRQRLEPEHLLAAHAARLRFAAERADVTEMTAYEDYPAVVHVHAEDSNHTRGTRAEVLAAAKKTGTRIVLFSDHGGPAPETWHGLREGVLFFAGEENGGQGLLRFPTFDASRTQLTNGQLRFLAHVEERYDADTRGFAGMEICNRHTDLVLDPSPRAYLESAATNPPAWTRVLEAFRSFPDELFAAGCDYRTNVFAKWDAETQRHPFTGVGATDAHQNVVLRGVTFDPYEVSFLNLRTHILARELGEAEVRAALREGRCYVSHDWLCSPAGFTFAAVNNLGVFPMGAIAKMAGTTRLTALTPLPARLRLIHHAQVIREVFGTNLTFAAKEPGAYRAEAWLEVDGEWRPWIYSNPVYLEETSLLSTRLPSAEAVTNVELIRGLTYVEGLPEDEAKHKLDLYVPKESEKARAPVFVFLHGGAWKSGDRTLYPPLGKRFAQDGILTVIPSYRLAPKHPHPAQVEDAAAALAWVVTHVAGYGGDTNRIFVGGHSAGGHLSALLALDPTYLQARGTTPAVLRGVIALSGVYNVEVGDFASSVFGKGAAERHAASPIFHVQAGPMPFLVTYCQWDYPTLPWQAKVFQAALQRSGHPSSLYFTPREDHISEVIAMTYREDPTASEVVEFIRKEAGAAR